MLNRILGGGLLLALALAAVWLYGKSQKNAGRLQERVEWTAQMQAFEKKSKDIIVSRINKVRADERANALKSEQVGYDIQKRLAALSDAVRLRASGGSNSNGAGSNLPVLSYAPIDPTGTSQEADMVACGEAVIKAEGWQSWYSEVSK